MGQVLISYRGGSPFPQTAVRGEGPPTHRTTSKLALRRRPTASLFLNRNPLLPQSFPVSHLTSLNLVIFPGSDRLVNRMADTEERPVDTRDALEVLESEAKEWDKDAEINRILQAFRLDA